MNLEFTTKFLFFFLFLLPIGIWLITRIGLISISLMVEQYHQYQLKKREEQLQHIMITTFHTLPSNWKIIAIYPVTAHYVMGISYYHHLYFKLTKLVGGYQYVFHNLLERAQKEVILRLKEKVNKEDRSHILWGLRLTHTIFALDSHQLCLGITAYGTALKVDTV